MAILIITEAYDNSTSYVVDWLLYKGIKFYVVDQFTKYESVNIFLNNENCVTGYLSYVTKVGIKIKILFDEIKVIWYRRGEINFSDSNILRLDNRFKKESEIISRIILEHLEVFKLCSFYFERDVNKLEMLLKAKEVGFVIPRTMVSNEPIAINEFINKSNESICKPLKTIRMASNNSVTSTVEEIRVMNDNEQLLFPKLLQEKIKKKYELRIVVIGEEIFPMAIFSQISDKASLDFRNGYDEIRMVPYKLNMTENDMILTFMKSIGQNCGSIDCIRNCDDELVFLEINPVGQYDFVSKNCNYNLDKCFADVLMESVNTGSIDKTPNLNKEYKVNSSMSTYVLNYNLELDFIDPFYKRISNI